MALLIEILVILGASAAILVPLLRWLSSLVARPSGASREGEEPDASSYFERKEGAVREGTGETAVWLVKSGPRKLDLIKAVRELTGLGLREAHALVEAAPAAVFQGLRATDAETARAALEAAGGTVELRGGARGEEANAATEPAATAWDVVLLDPGVSPDRARAALEEALGLTREAAEDAVMAAPGRVARGVAREAAKAAREALEAAGAQVAVRPGEG